MAQIPIAAADYAERAGFRQETLNLVGDRAQKTKSVPLSQVDTAGGVAAFKNASGKAWWVSELILDRSVKSTGACTLDAGVAANGTTSNDTLIDGLNAAAAESCVSNRTAPGTNGLAGVRVAPGSWVTVSVATGASAGLKGQALLRYHELDAVA